MTTSTNPYPHTSLVNATSGPLAGFMVAPVDIATLIALTKQCIAVPVRYLMGGKAHNLFVTPLDTNEIDCSGFVRWLLYHATHGALLLPDGSFMQDHALALGGFKPTDPGNCALHDGHVRVCIHIADDRDRTGHIWIVINGITYESHGGRGVHSRPYNTMLSSGYTLEELATHCFVLS